MSAMLCESCCKTTDTVPVCVDDDMETYMCEACIKSLNDSGLMTVEVMDLEA